MDTRSVIGWVIWTALFVLSTIWTYGCYDYYVNAKGLQRGTVNGTALWWLLVVWFLFHPGLSKLHLLWLAPLALAAGGVSGVASAGRSKNRVVTLGLVLVLLAYLALLYWLTKVV